MAILVIAVSSVASAILLLVISLQFRAARATIRRAAPAPKIKATIGYQVPEPESGRPRAGDDG